MAYEFYPIVFSIVLIIALVGFSILAKHLREKNRLKLQEMIHQERMMALEKEVPIPGAAAEDVMSPLLAAHAASSTGKSVLWVRLSALCIGLFMLFAGVGMWIAFRVSMDFGLQEIATVGIIPALAGVGLLLFYFMSGKLQNGAEELEHD